MGYNQDEKQGHAFEKGARKGISEEAEDNVLDTISGVFMEFITFFTTPLKQILKSIGMDWYLTGDSSGTVSMNYNRKCEHTWGYAQGKLFAHNTMLKKLPDHFRICQSCDKLQIKLSNGSYSKSKAKEYDTPLNRSKINSGIPISVKVGLSNGLSNLPWYRNPPPPPPPRPNRNMPRPRTSNRIGRDTNMDDIDRMIKDILRK